MWDFGGSTERRDAFLRALRGSHAVEVKAEVFDASTGASRGVVAVSDGSVRVDGGSIVRRVLSATFTDPAGSDALRDLLTDASGRPDSEVQVYRSIRYPNQRLEPVPVGRFRVDRVEDALTEGGAVKVTAPDLMARIVDDRFLGPRAGTVGRRVFDQISDLLTDTIADAIIYEDYYSGATVRAGVVWERERAEAVADLGRSIGCDVYADPEGNFRVSRTDTDGPAVWRVEAGARGVLLDASRSLSREGLYNAVRVTSNPTDGSTPVYATVQDAASIAAFGRVPRFYASPLISTTAQATEAALSLLAKGLGARATLTLDTIVNPALEVGDRIDVYLPSGSYERHVVDAFDLPLGPDAAMRIETRGAASVSGYEEG